MSRLISISLSINKQIYFIKQNIKKEIKLRNYEINYSLFKQNVMFQKFQLSPALSGTFLILGTIDSTKAAIRAIDSVLQH